MKAEGYSLWLMPTGEKYKHFSGLINKLVQENSAPPFKPHVTLIGGIVDSEEEIKRKVQILANGHLPFEITLGTFGYEDYYFRTLFIRTHETQALLELNDDSRELFNLKDTPPYMPHFSLMYGDYPQKLKDKIIQELDSGFDSQFEVFGIHIFKTEGEVGDWRSIGEYPLSKKPKYL